MTRTCQTTSGRPVGPAARVCALVPHFACEAWLGHALDSLARQTRPPDAVVVIDDATPDRAALLAVTRDRPEVTVLGSSTNVGPYALIQAVIDAGGFDAYLLQDADDWSAPERLATLLDTAAATGAELVGCSEIRVLADAGEIMPVDYPADVNAACAADPTAFALLHPTSLIGADLLDRLGGFATGLRFSGDAELLWRAVHTARVVNAPIHGYHRRKRAGSLTTDRDTGLTSPARLALHAELHDAARSRAQAAADGGSVDLTPHALVDSPVVLDHLAGPPIPGAGVCATPRVGVPVGEVR